MPNDIGDWKYVPIVAMFFLALWIWHKVMIEKVERICEKLERERDQWKRLAYALMEKCGFNIPVDLLPRSTTFKKKEEK